MRPVHLILLAALAIAGPAFAGVYECPPGSGHFGDMPCDGSPPPKEPKHADTSTPAKGDLADLCKEALTDFSGTAQLMAAAGVQRHDDIGACMAKYPSLLVSEFQDACRSTVAGGVETPHQALARILGHICN